MFEDFTHQESLPARRLLEPVAALAAAIHQRCSPELPLKSVAQPDTQWTSAVYGVPAWTCIVHAGHPEGAVLSQIDCQIKEQLQVQQR